MYLQMLAVSRDQLLRWLILSVLPVVSAGACQIACDGSVRYTDLSGVFVTALVPGDLCIFLLELIFELKHLQL